MSCERERTNVYVCLNVLRVFSLSLSGVVAIAIAIAVAFRCLLCYSMNMRAKILVAPSFTN